MALYVKIGIVAVLYLFFMKRRYSPYIGCLLPTCAAWRSA